MLILSSALQLFIKSRDIPPRLDDFIITLPEADDEHSSIQDHPINEAVEGLTFGIEYIDVKGEQSRRRITLKSYSDEYMKAYCHERGAPRTFKIDRINSIYHLTTGEIFEDVTGFLSKLKIEPHSTHSERQPQSSQHSAAMSKIRDGARILVWIGRADGKLCEDEINVIMEYCHTQCADMAEYNHQAMRNWVLSQYPDWETVSACINRQRDSGKSKTMMPWLSRIIDADHEISPEEFTAIQEIQSFLTAT